MKARIVFFGTPEFAVPTLEALVSAGYEIIVVVTQPDKPLGRGLKMEAPAVKVKAEKLGLRVLQPPSLRDEIHADLGIAVAYGKIIPKSVLDLFPRGILNVHPSLLPKYRGSSPIQAAILNGDTETGVTIMLLDEEMDHGPILAQAKIGITLNDTNGILSETLSKLGAQLLVETLPRWLDNGITPQPQDHSKAAYTKMLTREDGHIDWNKPAEYIERMIRAYDLWPGTFTIFQGKRLKIMHATLLHPTTGCASNTTPGYIFSVRHCDPEPSEGEESRTISVRRDPSAPRLGMTLMMVAVNCNPGSILLEQVQLEGKKPTSGAEFMRGHPAIVKTILQ